MSTVGVSEFRARMGAYLQRVRRGEVVRITDRGQVVAEIWPPRKTERLTGELAGLQRLIDRGVVSEGGPNDPALYKPTGLHCLPGTVQRLIDEDREDRL